MKRAIAVLGIVFGLLLVGALELFFVQNFITNMQNNIAQLNYSFPQTETNITEFYAQVNEIKQEWETKETLLCLLHNHKDLSVITETVNRLKTSVQLNDFFMAKQELNLLVTEIKKLPHTMSFSIQNIF